MKYTLLAYVSTLLLIYLTFKFGWWIADRIMNFTATLGIEIGELL